MKIAIVKLSALGDIIHAMVVLQFIKKYNPEIIIDWVVDESFRELLESHPDINKVYSVNLKKAKKKKSLTILLKEFRKIRQCGPYDIIIDLQGLIKSAMIAFLIPSRVTIGFDKQSAKEGAASFFYTKTFKYGYSENIIERNLAIVNFALNSSVSNQEIQYKLPLLYFKRQYLTKNFSHFKKNIILIPGASHISKCYPAEKLAKLSRLIDANYIIIWGNAEEKLLAEKIKSLSPQVNVSDKLSLEVLMSLISQADLVIGPDTGPTHMAWALNIPSVTIFGSTPSYRNTYKTKINKTIESDSLVNPLKINKNDYSIRDIKVEDLIKISESLL